MKKHLLLFLIVLLITFKGYSQCCSAGNPLGGDASNEGLEKNELKIFTSYKHSLSKYYYHFDAPYDIPNIEKSFYDFQNISISYGVFSRLSINTELGYFFNKTQEVKLTNDNIIIKAQGLGDMGVSIRYLLFKTVKPVSQLVISGGVRIPVGAFNEEINGATVPISLQPSSGALKFKAGIFYSRKRNDRKLGWNSFLFLEYSNTINQGYLVYKYGNLMQLSVAATYEIHQKLNLLFNTKFEWRAHDIRENEMIIESTGSKVIFLNPQLIFAFKPDWSFIVMADLPVYKYVNGYQLTNSFSFQLGIRKKFKFNKS
ncbi:MAG: transporter [Bacteroidetes bacterium]|nr:transporter [Bacteroidota bacterium]